jgi:hypothetical protein
MLEKSGWLVEAKSLIELPWTTYAVLRQDIRFSTSALMYAEQYSIAYWEVLTLLGDPEWELLKAG